MKRPVFELTFVAMAALLLSALAQAQQAEQANASDLIRSAERATGQVAAAAQNDPSLIQDEARAKPFWEGMQVLNDNLEKARTGLESQEESFFTALASSVAGFIQADIALKMNSSSDQAVAIGMETLGGILATLNENYSKEAARLRQGGELAASEQQQLDKLIAQQDELLSKLEEVERNVAQNNEEIKAGIAQIRENSRRIQNSRRTVGGFVGGFFSAQFMYNWLWGWHWWWGPWGGWCPGFIDINIIIWDAWIDDYIYDWAIVELYVETGDLGLDAIDIDDIELEATFDFLESGDFGLEEGDLAELTSELDYGWDDVSTDTGIEILEQVERNFDNSALYEVEIPIETFEDYGMQDFGTDLGGMDFGFDF